VSGESLAAFLVQPQRNNWLLIKEKGAHAVKLFSTRPAAGPPRAAATQAMKAPTSIDKAVKIERYAPQCRWTEGHQRWGRCPQA
jgi:hypothetical protein